MARNTETKIQSAIQEFVNDLTPATVWRNNTGGAYQPTGPAKKYFDQYTKKNIVQLNNPRFVRYGLCIGSSDLVGIMPITITGEMVGQKMGAFVALEVKTPRGQTTAEQKEFLRKIEEAGGIARVVRSVADVKFLSEQGELF